MKILYKEVAQELIGILNTGDDINSISKWV